MPTSRARGRITTKRSRPTPRTLKANPHLPSVRCSTKPNRTEDSSSVLVALVFPCLGERQTDRLGPSKAYTPCYYSPSYAGGCRHPYITVLAGPVLFGVDGYSMQHPCVWSDTHTHTRDCVAKCGHHRQKPRDWERTVIHGKPETKARLFFAIQQQQQQQQQQHKRLRCTFRIPKPDLCMYIMMLRSSVRPSRPVHFVGPSSQMLWFPFPCPCFSLPACKIEHKKTPAKTTSDECDAGDDAATTLPWAPTRSY